jgi:large subunit ribosomal protein L4e
MRYSRFVLRKGPLLVYGDENPLLKRTARNLPGVDTCSVHRLNLLQLAPGGHLGRFVIFTKDAFTHLNKVFGTYREKGIEKGGYQLNRSQMAIADLARIINSDQVQSKLRAIRTTSFAASTTNKNPLKNRTLMQRLNPYSKTARALEVKAAAARSEARKAALKHKHSKAGRKEKAVRNARFNALSSELEAAFAQAKQVVDDEIKAGLYNPNE